jgi:hypothetical protein
MDCYGPDEMMLCNAADEEDETNHITNGIGRIHDHENEVLVDLHQQQQQQQSPTSNQVVLDEQSLDDNRRNIGDAALSDGGSRSHHATSVEELPVVSSNSNHIRTNEMSRWNRLAEDAMNESPAPTTSENDEADAVVHDGVHQTPSRKRSWLSTTHQPLVTPDPNVLDNRTVNRLNGTNFPLLPSIMEAGLMDRTDNAGNDNERIGRQFSGNEVPQVNHSGISADELYHRTHHAMLEDEPHPNSNNVVGPQVNHSGISADELYRRTHHAMLEDEPHPNSNNVIGPQVNHSGISADELYRRTHHAMLEDEPHPNSNNVVGEANLAPSLQHVNERWLVHRATGYMARENMDDVEDSRNVSLVDHADALHSRVHYQQNDQLEINNYNRANLAPSRLPQRDDESRPLANEENVVVNDSRHGDREEVDVDLHAHDSLIVLLNRRITDMVFGHVGTEEYYILIVTQLEGFRHQLQRDFFPPPPHVVQHEWFHANNQNNRTRIAQNIINTWIMRGGHFATTTTRTSNDVVTLEHVDPRVFLATLHMLDYWIQRHFAADATFGN